MPGHTARTSTTSLTAAIFDAASLDPTVIIGGRINAYGANARLGQGEYLIAEADESDGSFLCLLPIINVVTNVDRDHLDHYGNQEAIDEAFVSFMNQIPFYGLNVVCGDDPGVERLLPPREASCRDLRIWLRQPHPGGSTGVWGHQPFQCLHQGRRAW